jgi:hypothetical protein
MKKLGHCFYGSRLNLAMVLLFLTFYSGVAQTYVNQRITVNGDGTLSTNWVECIIQGDVLWKASQGPYIVDNYDLGITVQTNGSLTIESGTVLEFPASRDWSGLQVFGALQASGGVVFRRSSASTNGTWSGIRFYTNSVGVLDQVQIEDAGHVTEGWQAGHPGAAVYIEDSSPTLRHVTIRRSGLYGVRLVGSSSPVLESNQIEQCPGHAVLWTDLRGTPVFKGNSGAGNNFNAIFVGNGTVGRDWTMYPNGIPYVLQGWDGNLTVASNATLTIPPGTVVKCSYGRDGGAIEVHGNLQCGGGAAPVILTSVEDDSVVGDTDNSSNAVYRGGWSGIRFQPGSRGNIDNAEIRYSGHVTSGWQAAHPGAAIFIDSASPTIHNVLITGAEGYGIRLTGAAQPHIEGNEINNSGDYAVLHTAFSGNPALINNRGTNNAHDGVFLPNGTLTTDTTFGPNPGLPYVTAGWDGFLVIDTNVTATILPGAVIKNLYGRDGGAVVVYGRLISQGTADQPIIWTSFEDDVQGDTDRTTNAVYAGAWSGFRIYAPGQATFSHSEIRNSGHVTSGWQAWHPGAAVYLEGGSASFDQVVIDHAQDLAVRLNGDGLSMRGCTFTGGPRGAWIASGGANSVINYCQFLDITDYAVINDNAAVEFDARNNWWGHVTGPAGTGPGFGAKASAHVRFDPYSNGTAARLYMGIPQTLQPPAGLKGPFQIVSGNLPAGLVFDPNTGTLTGSPTAAGSVLVGVRSVAVGGSDLPFYYVLESASFLRSPPDTAEGWTPRPTLTWQEQAAGSSYRLQVATDSAFTQVLLDAPGLTAAGKALDPHKPGTTYYWRVSSATLGNAWSPTASFRTWNEGPLSGYALSFDGVDDRVVLEAAPDVSQCPRWSMTAWINPAAAQGTAYPTIFSYGYWSASLGLNSASGALDSWLNNTDPVVGSKAVPTGQWSFVALTCDGTNRVLYLNGEEVGRGAGGTVTPASNAAIGAEPGGKSSSHFAGAIDEIAVWQTALDSETITQYMSRRLTGHEPGLVQAYHLDEGAGDVVYDCSSSQAKAVCHSSPAWNLSTAGNTWVELPELAVQFLNGQQISISWSAVPASFVLEQSTTLSAKGAWQAVTPAPTASDSGYVISINPAGQARFYRLRNP